MSSFLVQFNDRHGDIFDEIVNTDQLGGRLDGFVFFKNNIATHGHTAYSYSSIFSGEVYDGREEFSSFVHKTLYERAFSNELFDAGYRVNLVPGIAIPVKEATSYYRIPKTYGGTEWDKVVPESATLMDLVLFRYGPQFVKRLVYNDQQWFLQRFFSPQCTLGYYYQKLFSGITLSGSESIQAFHVTVFCIFYLPTRRLQRRAIANMPLESWLQRETTMK